MSKQKYEFHPIANYWRLLPADALVESIKENGLQVPIVLFEDKILDGRNRYRACLAAEVEPKFVTHEGDWDSALALAIALNNDRREDNLAQRALTAARALAEQPERRGRPEKGAPSGHNKSRDELAKVFKVGKNQIQQAAAILKDADDLVDQIESGAIISIAEAYQTVQDRRKENERKGTTMAYCREWAPDEEEKFEAGKLTLDQWKEKAEANEREHAARIASEADARQFWLNGIVKLVEWCETYAAKMTDERLAWYTAPDSPGYFDHGITPKRISSVVDDLSRVRDITFNGAHHAASQKGTGKPGKK